MSKLSNEDILKLAHTQLAIQIAKIKAAPAGSAIAKANTHLNGVDAASISFGVGAGELSCAGAIIYVLDCSLAVVGTYSCVLSFNSTGLSWDLGAFTAQVAGAFLVNPNDIAGECYFICVDADVGEGLVSFSLFGTEGGTFYGTFIGDTEGIDVADMSGTGTLSVS